MERSSTIDSARCVWLAFANLCGWDSPLRKSPLPSVRFRALGVFVDLSCLPLACGFIVVCDKRIDGIIDILYKIIQCKRLSSGLASSLCGKLVFTSSALAGTFGRAMMRAFRRRCYERRVYLNPQLRVAIDWWLRSLRFASPRPIPWHVADRPQVVTYSDGEGSDAGVGVAIWANCLDVPQAGMMDVPMNIRKLWSAQRAPNDGELHDIQEIEAIGPLIALATWPKILRGSLWLHFIDNNGALSCLVKGSSSCVGTDSIVGYTWKLVEKLDIFPWFDRVDSRSNPVDGLSRKDLRGPWQLIELVFPGCSLRAEIRRGHRVSPPS